MKFSITFVIIVLSVSMLGSCGGTGQDDSDTASVQTDFNGVAIDGYLARALVYVDTNDNNELDSWEPRAFTDDDGRYTTSLSSVDYCADPNSSDYAFCLRSDVSLTGAVIRVEGGYDVTTGEPFEGSLSNRVDIVVGEHVENRVVSPLTTLFVRMREPAQRSELLTALGITERDLAIDFLDTQGDGSDSTSTDLDSDLFAISLKVQKVVSTLSERIEDTYEGFGAEEGLPASATSFVFNSIVDILLDSSNPVTLGVLLDSDTLLGNIFDLAEEDIRDVYLTAEVELPVEIGAASVANMLSDINAIDEVIDSVIGDSLTVEYGDVVAGSRAVEIVIQKIMEEASDIDSAISFFVDGDELKDDLLALLDEDNVDLDSLSQLDLKDELTGENLNDKATFSVEPFRDLAGKQLHVYDKEETKMPPKDAEVIFYFNAGGKMQACVKWIDSALNDVGKPTDSDNTLGTLVDGSWSLINGGYSAIITLRIAGTTQEAIVKVAETADNGLAYRFDFNDEFDEWNSASGVVMQSTTPANSDECKVVLSAEV